MTFNSAQVQNALWEEGNPNPLPPTPRPPKRSLQKVRTLLCDNTFLRSSDKEENEEDDIRGTIVGLEVAEMLADTASRSPRVSSGRRRPSKPDQPRYESPRADHQFYAKPRPLPKGKTEEEVLNQPFKPVYKGSTSSHPLPNRHRGKQTVKAPWAKMSDEVKLHLDAEAAENEKPSMFVDMNGYVQSAAYQERQKLASKKLTRKINQEKSNVLRFHSHLQNVAHFSSRNRVPLRPTTVSNDRGEKVTLVLPRNLAHPTADRLIDKHYPQYRVLLNEGPHALLSPRPTLPPCPASAPHVKRRIMSADVKKRIQELADKYIPSTTSE